MKEEEYMDVERGSSYFQDLKQDSPVQSELDLQLQLAEARSYYEYADKGQRLLNFFIDRIFAFAILFFLFSITSLFQFLLEALGLENLSFFSGLMIIFIYFSYYPLYFVFFEHFNQGKSLAKVLTRTKVVTEQGRQPKFWNIVGRSYARLIPFNAFVVLFNSDGKGLHDMVSNTKVVRNRR